MAKKAKREKGDFKAYKSINRDQERLEDRGLNLTEVYEEPA